MDSLDTGLLSVGIEHDKAACATRAAAGHLTIRADVSTYPLAQLAGKVEGLIASPPCPDFSAAGKRKGINGTSGHLIFEVMRWALALRPKWIACEQVPEVLPWWRKFAADLREQAGYKTWTGVLCSADYGCVEACPLHGHPDSAPSAGPYSVPKIALEHAGAPAMPGSSQEPIGDAWIVVATLAEEIRQACAADATPGERVASLLRLVRREKPTPTGKAEDAPTNEATSECEALMGSGTGESIVSWLRDCWDDLWRKGRLSTTWTTTPPITVQRILRSIAATVTIWPDTAGAARRGGCGLCLDLGVPQERYRAFLLAHLDRQPQPPAPTHSENPHPSLLGGPMLPKWVSMAEGLGWGMLARPYVTVTTGRATTKEGLAEVSGGTGARRTVAREAGGGA